MGKKSNRKSRDMWHNTWWGALDKKHALNYRLTYLETCYQVVLLFGQVAGYRLEGGSMSPGIGFES